MDSIRAKCRYLDETLSGSTKVAGRKKNATSYNPDY